MDTLDPRLAAFIGQCDTVASVLGITRSTLSTKLFRDGKRLEQLALGGSDVGVRRLGEAERELARLALQAIAPTRQAAA